MKATIFLNEENHNPINLDGTLTEFMQGIDGSTIIMAGGENVKKFRGLFTEIREEGETKKMKGMIEGAVCILDKEGTETLYFPAPVRIHAI
jgi:N-acetylneuraminic acid mutarotase